MNRITASSEFSTQVDGLVEPVQVCDSAGRTLGHFVPVSVADDCPYSAEELARLQAEEGGRSLSEIWKTLGAK